MPTSKIYLPDVNVWIAMVFDGHVHNTTAMQWFDTVLEESIAFCRITQMGLLRLLTNSKVMGLDVLTQAQAWEAYDQLHQDARFIFLNEASGLEDDWRSLTRQDQPAPHAWTDAYLMAFAKTRSLTLVTFDQALHSALPSSLILSK